MKNLIGKLFQKNSKAPLGGKLGDVIAFHKQKALYIAIPKVANSSLKALSAEILGEELDKNLIDPDWKPSIFRSVEGRRFLKNKKILLLESTEFSTC